MPTAISSTSRKSKATRDTKPPCSTSENHWIRTRPYRQVLSSIKAALPILAPQKIHLRGSRPTGSYARRTCTRCCYHAQNETDICSAMISAHDIQELGAACTHTYSPHSSIWTFEIGAALGGPYATLCLQCNSKGLVTIRTTLTMTLSRPQHILAIEYKRSLMTAVVWGEECRDYWTVSGRVSLPRVWARQDHGSQRQRRRHRELQRRSTRRFW